MSTLHKITTAVQQLQKTYIAQAKSRRFMTGVNRLALRGFTSLNAAGRQLHPNRFTGEARMRRTVEDSSLADQVQKLLLTEAFAGQEGYLFCSMDHSQFGSFCIAVLAISQRKGRAIPIWCQVNTSEAALIAPLLSALTDLFETLATIAPQLNSTYAKSLHPLTIHRRPETVFPQSMNLQVHLPQIKLFLTRRWIR